MATDNRSIKIFIDNSDAMAKSDALKSKIEGLRAELNKLAAEGKKEDTKYISTEKAVSKLEKTYGQYQNKIQETTRILNNLSGSTYKELISVKKAIQKELQNEVRGTDSYNAKLKQLNAVQKEISLSQKEMNSQYGKSGSFLSRAADRFNKYFGIITSGIASITGLAFSIKKLTADAAAMEDVYADVMKTTGMTRDEVGQMNEEFKKIDTRTGREELNKIAEVGGRLGIAKDDIFEFTKAVDVANVALGDSFAGGAEEISDKLGKIQKLFKDTKDMELDKAFMSIGSSINELGANGAASEQNIADFATRVGSLPDALKPSVAQTLALGAAFEESGIESEIASRAYNIFMKQASVESAKFAKVMGVTTQEVENLINSNPTEFFLKFTESMKGMSAVDTARTLNELGVNADGANKAIGAAANNTNRFRQLIDLSNKSFQEGTSLLKEFGIKNNNAAAQLDKARKKFTDLSLELGSKLTPALTITTGWTSKLMTVIMFLIDHSAQLGKGLAILTGYFIAYNGTVIANNLALKEGIGLKLKQLVLSAKEEIQLRAMIVQEQIKAVTVGKTTTATKAAALAQAFWNNVIKANPIGFLVGALTTAIAAMMVFSKTTKTLISDNEALSDVQGKAAESISDEMSQLQLLLGVAKNESISKQEREKAIKKLNEISPEYLGNLTLENINTRDATTAVNNYTNALKENAMQKAISDKMAKLYSEKMDAEATKAKFQQKLDEDKARGLWKSNLLAQSAYKTRIAFADKSIASTQKEIDLYDKLNQKYVKERKTNSGTGNPVNDGDGGGNNSGGSAFTGGASSSKNKIDNLKIEYETELNLLRQKLLDEKITKEQFQTESSRLELEYLDRQLQAVGVDGEKRAQLTGQILEKQLSIKEAMLNTFLDVESNFIAREAELQNKANDARLRNDMKALRGIAAQNEKAYKEEFDRRMQQKANMVALGMDFANEMGNLLDGAISGNEDLVVSSIKAIINMGLDALKAQVEIAIAGVTAQELFTSGLVGVGLARAAIKIGLIEAAFGAAKAVVGSVIGNIGGNRSSSSGMSSSESSSQRVATQQRAYGKYDVLGADDGRLYRGVPYAGAPQTGVVSTPTLYGEYGSELVVSAPDFARLQRHINYPLVVQAIQQSRGIPQRADGNYENIPSSILTPQIDLSALRELSELIKDLKKNPIRAEVNYHEFEKSKYTIDNVKSKASRH